MVKVFLMPTPEWLTARPIAHRGLHALPQTPENSLASFAAAIQAGFPIELDVRLLADGEVAVFHDRDLARLTGAAGSLASLDARGLGELRLLGTGERVPLLSETLDLVAGQVPLLVELKTDSSPPGALEAATLQALSGYKGAFALQSFSTSSLAYLAAHAPQIVRGQLASSDNWREDDAAVPWPDFVAYSLPALPTPLSSALRARGIPVLAWTIQTPQQQGRAAEVADNYIFEIVQPMV